MLSDRPDWVAYCGAVTGETKPVERGELCMLCGTVLPKRSMIPIAGQHPCTLCPHGYTNMEGRAT